MAVANHLPRGASRIREAEAEDNVIQARLEKLEQDFAGDSAAGERGLEVAAELALQDAVLVPELLLLGECDGVIRLLPARAFRAVHSGRIVLVFERLRWPENRDAEAAADFVFGTGVTCHD